MKIKKLLAIIASSALALTLGAVALVGCGGKTEDYTFEAENAVTEGNGTAADQSQSLASAETNVLWAEDGQGGEEVTGLGGFNTVGQKIIWKVNAASATTVTITLYAASAQMVFDESGLSLAEVDLGDTNNYAFKVNDAAVTLTGTLPKTTGDMTTPGFWWHVGTASATADLKAGENTVVFEIVGQASFMGSGVNVDKIVISSSAKLS